LYCDIFILRYFHIDMVTDCILDSDRYRCFLYRTSVSNDFEIPMSFPFPELPFPILFPIKKYENGKGFSVFQSFPTVFIPNHDT
jgi:hypothetical protein